MDPGIFRVLDANMNRAFEGLRVLEETARLIRNDAVLASELKDIRHTLAGLIRSNPDLADEMIRARDVGGDILREGETESERNRRDIDALVRANARRSQEAVRVLEEYGKLVSEGFSGECKRIRFRIYSAEKLFFNGRES